MIATTHTAVMATAGCRHSAQNGIVELGLCNHTCMIENAQPLITASHLQLYDVFFFSNLLDFHDSIRRVVDSLFF